MHSIDSFDAGLGRGTDWVAKAAEPEALAAPGAFTTLRQMLLPRTLPEAESLSEVDLIAWLNELEIELLQKRYRIEFLDRLPARVAFRGLRQLLDSPVAMPEPFELVEIDGCDSACEVCFQLAHCPVARDVLGAAWNSALEHAGANPSWVALYAGDFDPLGAG